MERRQGRLRDVDNWGPVLVDEVVAIEYRGDREFINKAGTKVTTGSFRATRKPPPAPSTADAPADAEAASDNADPEADDDIPF